MRKKSIGRLPKATRKWQRKNLRAMAKPKPSNEELVRQWKARDYTVHMVYKPWSLPRAARALLLRPWAWKVRLSKSPEIARRSHEDKTKLAVLPAHTAIWMEERHGKKRRMVRAMSRRAREYTSRPDTLLG